MISYAAQTILILSFYQTFPVANTKDEWSIAMEKEKFKTRCLAFHNTIRVLHGAPYLVWEESLGESTQAWASYLNTIQKMKISDSKFGENIFAAENPKNIDLICEYACLAWHNERRNYDPNNPVYSSKTGHFTQMVWKGSRSIGIGEAGQAEGRFFIVARYYPPGNIEGQFKENVLPKRKLPKSCFSKLPRLEALEKLAQAMGIHTDEYFFMNSSEPCVGFGLDGEIPHEGKPATQGTQETQATQGAQGTQGAARVSGQVSKPVTRSDPTLVGVPIAEPTDGKQPQVIGEPFVIGAPCSTTEQPCLIAAPSLAAQRVIVTSPPPVPSPTPNAVHRASSSVKLSLSLVKPLPSLPVVTKQQSVTNPVRVTNAFDCTPGKQCKWLMLTKLGTIRKP